MTENPEYGDKPPIDIPSVLHRLEGDESFLQELLVLYSENFQEITKNLNEALSQQNFEKIQELGHSLKGASANLSLPGLQHIAHETELAGTGKNLPQAKKRLAALKKEYHRLQKYLFSKNG